MSEALLFAEHGENMLCTKNVLNVRNNFCTQHVLPRFELGIFMYWTCNSMNNLSSYCGLVDAKKRASDKDLPVTRTLLNLQNWTNKWYFSHRVVVDLHDQFLLQQEHLSQWLVWPPPYQVVSKLTFVLKLPNAIKGKWKNWDTYF